MPLYSCMGKGGDTGSIINISAEDTGFYNQSVSLSDGTTTLTGTFSSLGKCTLENVKLLGTLTVSSSTGTKVATNSFEAPYFGTYNVELEIPKTITITTEESTLIGETVTATYDTDKTKTAVFDSNGEATIEIFKYTGSVTISATDGTDTAEVTIALTSGIDDYEVELKFVYIYGVYWDGSSSPTMTRTDDAANFLDPSPAVSNGNGSSPFDNIMPWRGMTIVEDSNAGTLVSIPKYYYKWSKTGTTMTLQISDKGFNGSHVSPAHADRGDGQGERDYVYVGRYHCATSTYKSTSGVKPQNYKTLSTFRTSIHNLGSDIWQYDFAMYWTIMMLYLVEFANWDSQAKIGCGCGDGDIGNMGYTDSMTYHTGTTQAYRTAYGFGTQYRHIEGLWDNVLDGCDGIYFAGTSNKDIYVINNPANFSDSSGGTKVGTRIITNANNIKQWSMPSASGFEWALYPSKVVEDTSYTTYICDQCYSASNTTVLGVGGSISGSKSSGAFNIQPGTSTNSPKGRGSRLMKLPNNS